MNAARDDANSIDRLPAQTVRRLGGRSVDQLRDWSARNGHRFVLAECAGCVEKESVLKAIGRAFGFPDWYGANLDALYDCLIDLPESGAPGWVVIVRLPSPPQLPARERAALLEVFRDAAADFASRGVGLRVFYG